MLSDDLLFWFTTARRWSLRWNDHFSREDTWFKLAGDKGVQRVLLNVGKLVS